MPEQKIQATLLEKGKYRYKGWIDDDGPSVVYYATFEFSDGTRHRMDIGGFMPKKTYKSLHENEIGSLYYYKGTNTFLRFECDSTQLSHSPISKIPIRKSVSEPENELKIKTYLTGTNLHRVDATVLEKTQSGWHSKMYITFSCANKLIKKFSVSISNYATIMRGDAGVLTFEKGEKEDKFVNFERDVSL